MDLPFDSLYFSHSGSPMLCNVNTSKSLVEKVEKFKTYPLLLNSNIKVPIFCQLIHFTTTTPINSIYSNRQSTFFLISKPAPNNYFFKFLIQDTIYMVVFVIVNSGIYVSGTSSPSLLILQVLSFWSTIVKNCSYLFLSPIHRIQSVVSPMT